MIVECLLCELCVLTVLCGLGVRKTKRRGYREHAAEDAEKINYYHFFSFNNRSPAACSVSSFLANMNRTLVRPSSFGL